MSVQLIGTMAFLVITGNLCVGASSIKTNGLEPCHYLDTVPIDTNSAQQDLKTGIVSYNNISYEKSQIGWFDYVYINGSREESERHLRGCLCKVLKGACFRICQENYDPKTPITAALEEKIGNLTRDQLVYGQPCANMHPGNENAMKLQKDGTLYDSKHKISINHEFYCLNVDKNVVVSTLICDPGISVNLPFNASLKFSVCRTPEMSFAPNGRDPQQRLSTIAERFDRL
jgi:Methuselah N-terminus